MNILMIGGFEYSGRTRHIFTLAGELNRLGHPAAVVMPNLPLKIKKECIENYKVDVITGTDRKTLNRIFNGGIDLIHVHSPGEAALASDLSRAYSAPVISTIHELYPENDDLSLYNKFSAVITTHHALPQKLKKIIPVLYIPDGVKITKCRPVINKKIKAVYIADENNYTCDSYFAVTKAVKLAGLQLEVINSDEPIPGEPASGWTADPVPVLHKTDIVVAGGRALIEGIACRNTALIMGACYNGIFKPPGFSGESFDCDISGKKGKSPCYRDIFYDLSGLLKNKNNLYYMQEQGYQYACRNFDITDTAEKIIKIYMKAAGQGK